MGTGQDKRITDFLFFGGQSRKKGRRNAAGEENFPPFCVLDAAPVSECYTNPTKKI
jgi:hypothetical protein